jgi:hypothetical protein
LLSQLVRRDRKPGKHPKVLDIEAVCVVRVALRARHERHVLKLKGIRLDLILAAYPRRVLKVTVDELRRIGAELRFQCYVDDLALIRT